MEDSITADFYQSMSMMLYLPGRVYEELWHASGFERRNSAHIIYRF